MRRILSTEDDWLLLIFRLVLGAVMFAHGAQKVFGWFGGRGLDPTFAFFAGLGIPAWLGTLAIVAEFGGSIALMLGLLGRVAALGIIVNMLVAMVMVHGRFGWFMNWANNQQGEGIEFHLITIALALALVARGSGPLSADLALSRRP